MRRVERTGIRFDCATFALFKVLQKKSVAIIYGAVAIVCRRFDSTLRCIYFSLVLLWILNEIWIPAQNSISLFHSLTKCTYNRICRAEVKPLINWTLTFATKCDDDGDYAIFCSTSTTLLNEEQKANFHFYELPKSRLNLTEVRLPFSYFFFFSLASSIVKIILIAIL